MAAITAASARLEPIERSMLPVMIRIAVPTATIATIDMFIPITRRLLTVAKFSFWVATTTTQTPRASRSPRLRPLPRRRSLSLDGSANAAA